VTNCALTAFTNKLFQNIREGDKAKDRILLLVIVVVAWEHFMLLLKYAMQSFFNPMPKSVILSLKKDKYERDMKASRDVRKKKHSRSRNSTKSASAMNESSVVKRSDVSSGDPVVERERKVTIEQEPLQPIQPNSVSVGGSEVVFSSDGLIMPNEMALLPSSDDAHVSANPEPENEEKDLNPLMDQKSLGSSMQVGRLALQSVGRSNNWSYNGSPPKRSPLRSSTPAFSTKLLSSPRNTLRRRIASTSACDLHFDKENVVDGGKVKEDDPFSSQDDDVHLPTPRRLRLDDSNSGKGVNELRKMFERKSS
jgi:hypothetical protein